VWYCVQTGSVPAAAAGWTAANPLSITASDSASILSLKNMERLLVDI
jgi:hypothetical protein